MHNAYCGIDARGCSLPPRARRAGAGPRRAANGGGAGASLRAPPCARGQLPRRARFAARACLKTARSRSSAHTAPSLPQEDLFRAELAASAADDFSDFEALECLQVGGRDRLGRPCILIVGASLPAWERVDRARFRRFVYRTLAPVAGAPSLRDAGDAESPGGGAGAPYCVVYCHTDVTEANRPGAAWLFNAFEALPEAWQEQLASFYVVHPAATLRGTLAMLPFWIFSPFASGSFGHKVIYLDRLDMLWAHMEPSELHIMPTFVAEHDKELAEHPLLDYGVVGPPTRELAREVDAMAGVPPDMALS
jgi:hypothetical protein